MNLLSRSEELILLAVWKLQGEAHGLAIRRHLMTVTGQTWSIGSVYVPLDKLVKLQYLDSQSSAPTAQRGGRSKRLFSLTERGLSALNQVKLIQQTMWEGLPALTKQLG